MFCGSEIASTMRSSWSDSLKNGDTKAQARFHDFGEHWSPVPFSQYCRELFNILLSVPTHISSQLSCKSSEGNPQLSQNLCTVFVVRSVLWELILRNRVWWLWSYWALTECTSQELGYFSQQADGDVSSFVIIRGQAGPSTYVWDEWKRKQPSVVPMWKAEGINNQGSCITPHLFASKEVWETHLKLLLKKMQMKIPTPTETF